MSQSRFKAVLFDLDGTLLDTLLDLANSVNDALRRLGFATHPTPAYRYFVGEGREIMALKSLPPDHRDPATVNKLVALINQEYSRQWAINTRPYPGIPELLDTLAGMDIRTAVLSNKADDISKTMVAGLLGRWRFDVVRGALNGVPKKPDPTAALQIANELHLKPSEFIYLGDSDIDMKTAAAAGIYPVGALWGFRTEEELARGGAKVLVKHPMELMKILRSERA
ncbi:MAG: HAD family hydrolase [Dehalococcoidia bacterium]|nr:HAD family hydrolase [Dehalococcoidia bacterium]